jgi:dolichyl-phosphate-mannose-protein mannosyltransferase
MEERFSILLSRTVWVGCLLGISATVYFLFGLWGYVHSPALNMSVTLVQLLSGALFLLSFFTIARETNRSGRIVWAATLILIMIEVMLSLLPPTSRDELTHHLAIPKLYANAGRIIEVPMAPYAYYPMLLDMLYTPWVYWGYDFVPKLIHGLFAFLTGLLLYAYLARRMNAVYGLLGCFFYLSMPVIARLSHWGYIDLGMTFYTTASLLCLLHWVEERDELRWLALAALSLGFALASKPNGLVAALLICSMLLLIVAKPSRKQLAAVSCELLLFGGLMFLPFAPWLIKNWFQTSNPFYPLLGAWFSPGNGAANAAASFPGFGILEKRELLYGENIWQILLLPLKTFFSGQDDNPRFFDGVLTPILIVFLPWAFKGKWLEEKKLLAAFSLVFLFYALFLVDLRIRYVLSIVPPLVILALYGVFNIYLRIKRPVYLLFALILFAGWHGVYLWRYVREAEPFHYLAGRESRDAYLERMLPEYTSFQYINRSTPPEARIYLLFIGRRAYYCGRDYFHDGGDLPGYLLWAIRQSANAEQIFQALKQKHITYLMAREDLLGKFLSHNLTPDQAAIWNRFAESRLTLGFRDHGYAVYQLHG